MEILYRAILRLNNEPSVLGLGLQMHQGYWRLNIHYIDYAKCPKDCLLSLQARMQTQSSVLNISQSTVFIRSYYEYLRHRAPSPITKRARIH
jgi:hypothetical protein